MSSLNRLGATAAVVAICVVSTSCGCVSGEEVRLVSRRGERYFVCDPDVGIGDSDPPTCGVKPGEGGNPRLAGPAVDDLGALVEDYSTAYVRLTFDCDRVIRVDAP